jgi:DNA mismatch repair protein MutS
VTQARKTLQELELRGAAHAAAELSPASLDSPQQMGLFTAPSIVADALGAIEPDELTPKQALEALYRLKQLL